MPLQLNDEQLASFELLTGIDPGQLNDVLVAHLKSISGSTSNDPQDLWYATLTGLGLTGSVQDMQLEYWADITGTTGQWNDLYYQWLLDTGGAFGPNIVIQRNNDPGFCNIEPPITDDCATSETYTAIDSGFSLPPDSYLWTIEPPVVGVNLTDTTLVTCTVDTVLDTDDVTFNLKVVVGGPGPSAEVQAVFDRMSALSTTEEDAIEAYVDGLVADGIYANITEIYAPCLNGTDYKTGFKARTLIDSASPPVHTPGEFVAFTTNAQHFLENVNFDTYATVEGFIAIYNVFIDADTVNNSDLCGIATAGNECYLRWRGNDTNDFNALYNVTSATPRSAAATRPDGDLIGFGLEGTDVFVLQPGGVVVKATRTPNVVPAGNPLQWHGQNIDGTPTAGNVANSRYSLMVTGNSIIDTNAIQARVRGLQFLRDIGVTGVPAT